MLTKKTGPLNVTWNGVAMLQVPKGKTDKESNAIAKTVLIQRKEWGGGEVWFDGDLIRKDGMFLPKDLQPLNPKNLIKA